MIEKTKSRVGRPKGENVENANRRRKQLIDAAVASIVEHGLSATTLATVARASGLSQGTAVFYFKSKDTLLYETFRFRLDEYRSGWMNAVSAAGEDPVDRLVALVLASLDPHLLNQQNLTFWNSFWPEASRNKNLNDISERYDAERQTVQMALCEETKAYFANDIWTPRLVANTLETMTDGVWSRLHYSPDYMTVKDARNVAAALLSTIFPAHAVEIIKKANHPVTVG